MAQDLADIPAKLIALMETIPISEAKDRLTELADRAAREHDHSRSPGMDDHTP
ncbi:hypothetical protein N5079_09560 [Planotetraspora sp. A-T 1434]|uniref:hypothetical protein n=1 Tax=Planotetraspora sp. A-T 1434 TaxID=2979219 RepID=UPI0021C12A11|nr:hypothetical protein [Planotetraspora sp. A-T 1434]MCT9930462.1 hypothetical protein [Planotetraspora sp. A-T 1434]